MSIWTENISAKLSKNSKRLLQNWHNTTGLLFCHTLYKSIIIIIIITVWIVYHCVYFVSVHTVHYCVWPVSSLAADLRSHLNTLCGQPGWWGPLSRCQKRWMEEWLGPLHSRLRSLGSFVRSPSGLWGSATSLNDFDTFSAWQNT